MNNKGQIGIAVIIAVMIFLSGMVVINILKPEVTIARDATTGLDCSNATGISDGTKLTCLTIDLVIPYFILIILAGAGGIITNKVMLRKK